MHRKREIPDTVNHVDPVSTAICKGTRQKKTFLNSMLLQDDVSTKDVSTKPSLEQNRSNGDGTLRILGSDGTQVVAKLDQLPGKPQVDPLAISSEQHPCYVPSSKSDVKSTSRDPVSNSRLRILYKKSLVKKTVVKRDLIQYTRLPPAQLSQQDIARGKLLALMSDQEELETNEGVNPQTWASAQRRILTNEVTKLIGTKN
jgi:hypothetical protein